MLEIGTKAPDFSLPDQNGDIHTLEEYRGRKVVLYFYPKDSTAGCTKQAVGFAELNDRFLEKGAVVVGVSKDSVTSHRKFTDKFELPFTLLADTSTQMLQDFGAWGEKKMCGKTCVGTLRKTFIFNEEGILEKIIEKVDTKNHTEQILASGK